MAEIGGDIILVNLAKAIFGMISAAFVGIVGLYLIAQLYSAFYT